MQQHVFIVLVLGLVSAGGALAGALADHGTAHQLTTQFDSPAYRVISDEDRTLMQHVRNHMDSEFSNLNDVAEVTTFLDKVKLLVQKHPKNTAFAQGDLKELHKFLSQEMVTRLIRVDTYPFEMPIDDKMHLAQKAVEEDELTRKLFGNSLSRLVEKKKEQSMRTDDGGNHRDGNFFSNFWCKISGNCSN